MTYSKTEVDTLFNDYFNSLTLNSIFATTTGLTRIPMKHNLIHGIH